jgi:hypothetical protein
MKIRLHSDVNVVTSSSDSDLEYMLHTLINQRHVVAVEIFTRNRCAIIFISFFREWI